MSDLEPRTSKHPRNCTLPLISTAAIVLAAITPCVSFQTPLKFDPLHKCARQHFIYLPVATAPHLRAKTRAHTDDCESREKANEKKLRKSNLHPRNVFQGSYDMEKLCSSYPLLSRFVRPGHSNKGDRRLTIDFSDPDAVRTLNAALLAHHYGIQHWQEYLLPSSLIPPIPGREDYVHHIADVLASSSSIADYDDNENNKNSYIDLPNVPVGPTIRGLDIGTGASMIIHCWVRDSTVGLSWHPRSTQSL